MGWTGYAPGTMARHVQTKARCARCRLHTDRCICAALPDLAVPIPLVLVQHWKEARKPTSTGGLLCRLATACDQRIYGQRDRPFHADGLNHKDTWLVFPAREPADPLPTVPPRQLVVVDGTWGQASRLVRRIPALARLPRLSFSCPAREVPRLRLPHAPEARSTMEAVADAYRMLGHPHFATQLEAVHDRYVLETLRQRGTPRAVLSELTQRADSAISATRSTSS